MLSLSTNLFSLITQRQLALTSADLLTRFERLSSGMRIRRAADDPAGLGISERLRAQVRSFSAAQRNVDDGLGLVRTAEGVLGEVSTLIGSLRELLTRAGNGTLSSADLATINDEFRTLGAEAQRLLNGASFSGNPLFTTATGVTLQIGPNGTDTITVERRDLRNTVNLVTTANVLSASGRTAAAQAVTALESQINALRGSLGATENRLASIQRSNLATLENLTLAESQIRDADVAAESALLTKGQILQQAQVALLAQANLQPELLLELFRFRA